MVKLLFGVQSNLYSIKTHIVSITRAKLGAVCRCSTTLSITVSAWRYLTLLNTFWASLCLTLFGLSFLISVLRTLLDFIVFRVRGNVPTLDYHSISFQAFHCFMGVSHSHSSSTRLLLSYEHSKPQVTSSPLETIAYETHKFQCIVSQRCGLCIKPIREQHGSSIHIILHQCC